MVGRRRDVVLVLPARQLRQRRAAPRRVRVRQGELRHAGRAQIVEERDHRELVRRGRERGRPHGTIRDAAVRRRGRPSRSRVARRDIANCRSI